MTQKEIAEFLHKSEGYVSQVVTGASYMQRVGVKMSIRRAYSRGKRSESILLAGERIDSPILSYAPLNEQGVILLFGYYMKRLGFSHIEQIGAPFPDAIGMRTLAGGKLKRVRIEFEYESKNFEAQGHNPNQCDYIVCWSHNWKTSPPNLKVVELKTLIPALSAGD